jgi:TRAP-type C4-dicarboxylate transport system permease small subunit
MGKRKKKGPSRKRQPAMTRRDVDDKRLRREDRARHSDGAPADDRVDDDEPDDEEDQAEAAAPPDSEDAGADAGDAPAPSSAPSSTPSRPPAGAAGWTLPLVALERRWTWIETRVLAACLGALTLVLCFWITLRGLSEPVDAAAAAGTVFRGLVGAAVVGAAARFATRGRLEEPWRSVATVVAVILGALSVGLWRGVGVMYVTHLLDWLQEGSSLTLMGGLHGISTRLTMAVALIGASLAAASGTHINIDVVLRLIPEKLRMPAQVFGGLATALVCFLTAWGLYDHIAVTAFKVDQDATMGVKTSTIVDNLDEQFFLWRKQLGFDLEAAPRVIGGGTWNADDRMNGRQWNAFLDEEGFVERYGSEKVDPLKASEEDLAEPWRPFVVAPGGEARGVLINGMNLIFPFGFLMIALRFVLRALLVAGRAVHDEAEGGGEAAEAAPAPKGDRDLALERSSEEAG